MVQLRRLLLLLVLCFLPLAQAWAHAALLGSEPADGSNLAAAPAALELRFDEAVTLLDLRLAGPGGTVPLPGSSRVTGSTLHAALPAALGPGTYLATFRIISADGHPVSGGIAFGIRTAPDLQAAADSMASADWVTPAEVLRFLLYLGFALGAGGALFRALVAEPAPRLRRWMAAAAFAGMLAALGGIGIQGGGMLAAPSMLALLDGATWSAATGSSVLARSLVVALGLALVGFSAPAGGRAGGWGGVAGAVLAAAGFSLAGHAATGGTLPQALLVAHVMTAAFWLGSFPPLVAALRAQGSLAIGVVRRFAAIAMAAVIVLLLSGAAQAALRLPDVSALVDSRYGQLVLAKGIGALLLLTLAAYNHRRLTPRLAEAGAARAMIRSIGAESALAAMVLGLTAVLSMTSPHAAPQPHHHEQMGAPPSGAVVATQQGGLTLLLEADPARPGVNRLVLHVTRQDGSPLTTPELWIEFSQPQAGVAGIRRRMREEAPGRFVQEGPELALPGRWTLRAEILVSDFDQVAATLHLDLAALP
jgi:copper transport protein